MVWVVEKEAASHLKISIISCRGEGERERGEI